MRNTNSSAIRPNSRSFFLTPLVQQASSWGAKTDPLSQMSDMLKGEGLMLITAVTGGIASGKSVVTAVLRDLGCHIFSADEAARDLMTPDSPAWSALKEHFGENIFLPDRTIDRAALGSILFSDPREREFVNHLIHPLVEKKRQAVVQKLLARGQVKIFVSEAALTIESRNLEFFDKIIVVYCTRDIQVQRLMSRDRITKPRALQKIESQMRPEDKLPFADYIIETSGSLRETIEKSEQLYRNLLMDYVDEKSIRP